LEAQYREQLVKVNEAKQLSQNLAWLKVIPTKELVARGSLPATDDKVTLFREVLRFYGVSGVDSWKRIWDEPAAAARRSTAFASSPGPTSAWLRLGQLQAREIECLPFEKKRFSENLQAIRKLTTLEPADFLPQMRQLCAEAGVALTLVPEFKKAPWSGAAEWLEPKKAMIQLCLRGKSEDKFWFTFFHEAGHILHEGKKKSFLDDDKTAYEDDPAEKRADAFAASMLIPSKFEGAIVSAKSKADVVGIAQQLKLSPGIVAGRYQFLTKRWNYFNDLKRKFAWEKEGA